MATSMRLMRLSTISGRLAIPARRQGYNILLKSISTQSVSKCRNQIVNASISGSIGRRLPILQQCRFNNSSAQTETKDEEYHSIIKNTERGKGQSEKHEFQAETRKLLDIVARSLYSEKEVFIRELISNASDALERLRYLQLTGADVVNKDTPLEIHIAVDEEKKTFTIQDTGVGMNKDEMINNLGIIAKSGSQAFIEQLKTKGSGLAERNIIGQFGVGFYSTFMVGETIDVYSQPYAPDAQAHKWRSDGLGTYEISAAEGVQRGTKIVVHLKGDCYDFAKEDKLKEIIKKYSNFVGVPLYLNGKKVNVIQPLWMMETRDITEENHNEFYRYIANAYDNPRYCLHYKTDSPLNLRALFYVPEYKPTLFDMSRETDISVTLYSRKVMILAKANSILPKWLRFLKGVVDSEDIPLNLSRELLQDSGLVRKIRWVLTNRLLKFFSEQAKRDPEKYLKFYEDFGLFFREGIVSTPEQEQREEISKLLRFESSKLAPGEFTGLDDYVSRMKAGGRTIYYLSAPSRQLAETSPYMEALQDKDAEVLFCYQPYDELVLMNLGQFDKKSLKSVENESFDEKASKPAPKTDKPTLSDAEADELIGWLKVALGNKINKAQVSHRLSTHPCIVTVTEMGAARHFLRTALADKSEEERIRVLQPTLEINTSHPIIYKLHALRTSNFELAKLIAEQIYDNALIAAGLLDDPRKIINRMNDLLTKALEKH